LPEVIYGPPGTGKTENLLKIVEEEMARGTPAEKIGFITFTKKGAREASDRARAKFGLSESQLRYFSTIHAICFRSLGMSNGDVLEGKKMREFGDWIGYDVSEFRASDEGSTFGFSPADRALFMENLARVRCISLRAQYDEDDDGLPWDMVDKISRGLAQFKKDRHLRDYTDMLEEFVEAGWHPHLEVLLVDETQDLSLRQHEVVQLLATGCRRVVYAGDDDQAIYRWAGADVDSFIDMEGSSRVLGQSWRVPRLAQQVADFIIGRVHNRHEKEWKPRPEEGEVVRVMKPWDVDYGGEDVLILGRNASILKPVMRGLERDGVVYEFRGHPSVRSSLIEAISSWESLRSGAEVSVDEAIKVYEFMSSGRGVARGHKKLPNFTADERVNLAQLRGQGGLQTDTIWHDAMDRIPDDEKNYIIRARRAGEKLRRKPRVRVSTIHGIKGGQAEHVIILRDMAPRTHAEMRLHPEDEARVWYVAATRVRQKMTIVAPGTSLSYDM
jgi:DNA helicase-2/ATP-dependent DNA helicase PcrA